MNNAIYGAISRLAPPAASGGARVLLYHAIGDRDPVDRMALRVQRDRFIEQMTTLRDDGYTVVPLASIFQRDDNRHRVAITFDDGYESQLWGAEVLRRFEFPATFFIVPRYLDGVCVDSRYWERWGHMGWKQAEELTREGFELGAHSTTHPDLTSCDDSELRKEVAGSRAMLEQRLGRTIISFSYPFGRHNHRVRDAVQAAGYQLACTSRYGVNRTIDPRYGVCRTEVGGDDDLKTFRRKLRGKYDWLRYWQDLERWRYPAAPSS